jgi:large subunit ribosomal protein L7Ae
VVAIADVNKEDLGTLQTLATNFHGQYNEKVSRTWGGGIMGLKTQKRLEIREKLLKAEQDKKIQANF